MDRFIFLILFGCSFGFICTSDEVDPDDELLIINESSDNIYIFVSLMGRTVDTIRCGVFESLRSFDQFFITSGSESLIIGEFAEPLRDNRDFDLRVYVYKVVSIADVPLCPEPIEDLADTLVVRTVDDLQGDNFTPIVIE